MSSDTPFWRQWSEKIEAIHIIVAAVIALFVAGATTAAIASTYTTRNDLEKAVEVHAKTDALVYDRINMRLDGHDARLSDQAIQIGRISEDTKWISSTLRSLADHQHVTYAPPPDRE